MEPFVRNLISEWRRLSLPTADATFVVGVSGGADSVSLLLGLHDLRRREKLQVRIVAAHFNHHLRGEESDADEDFVKQLTAELDVELALGGHRVDPAGNLEQNARRARYDLLISTARNLGARGILTGHTINDQAETFLMNLIRGSGANGLCAMRAVRTIGETVDSAAETAADEDAPALPFPSDPLLLVRPLLTWAERRDTENYCRSRGVEYRYDTMNDDLTFTRVRIRKLLIPMLEDFNPKIVDNLAKTAALLQTTIEQAGNELPEVGETLELKALKAMDPAAVNATLRAWLQRHRGGLRGLDTKHIQAIEQLISSGKSGKTVELPAGETVVKEGGRLIFRNLRVVK